MNFSLRIPLHTTAEQSAKLQALQRVFAQACNALAPIVQGSSCWNRVALHHMAYRQLRQQFPELGSQMVCNAIYSVSRTCRIIYQDPKSPFNAQNRAGKALPRVHFLPQSPVYFDRHTLSLKRGMASMLTLDGRMRFNLPLQPSDEQRFRADKLREIVLTGHAGQFMLTFVFAVGLDAGEASAGGDAPAQRSDASAQPSDAQTQPSDARAQPSGAPAQPSDAQQIADAAALPEYVLVIDAEPPSASPSPLPSAGALLRASITPTHATP